MNIMVQFVDKNCSLPALHLAGALDLSLFFPFKVKVAWHRHGLFLLKIVKGKIEQIVC
jgi:hypothetical protein